jgi:dihydroorotate dehydrogenase (NAD+) catalytic subunit
LIVLHLPNGFAFDFCCAAGALGFAGDGWWWEQPLRWLGLLRPQEFLVIAKTVTYAPRAGNLKWWCPWRCVRLIPGGAVNAVGLTNMGYQRWIAECYPQAQRRGYALAASIQPTTPEEAIAMVRAMRDLHLKAIEINLSCPNTQDHYDPLAVVQAARQQVGRLPCAMPLIAKLGYADVAQIPALSLYVDAFDLINTVPWHYLYSEPSPLALYALTGGVSGRPIARLARVALQCAASLTTKPIISGGGIDCLDEVLARAALGAAAFSLGTVFLRAPWRPNRIVSAYRRLRRNDDPRQPLSSRF